MYIMYNCWWQLFPSAFMKLLLYKFIMIKLIHCTINTHYFIMVLCLFQKFGISHCCNWLSVCSDICTHPKLLNTLKHNWPILDQRKTSLVVFLWKRRTCSVVFLATILFQIIIWKYYYGQKKNNWTRSPFS